MKYDTAQDGDILYSSNTDGTGESVTHTYNYLAGTPKRAKNGATVQTHLWRLPVDAT